MQGVGSVIAIAAAIWIDRGTARRQRRERMEERDSAIRARLAAVPSGGAFDVEPRRPASGRHGPGPGHESGRADAFVMDGAILAGNIATSKAPADFKIVGEKHHDWGEILTREEDEEEEDEDDEMDDRLF